MRLRSAAALLAMLMTATACSGSNGAATTGGPATLASTTSEEPAPPTSPAITAATTSTTIAIALASTEAESDVAAVARFDDFLDASFEQLLLRSPQTLTELGLAPSLGMGNDRLDDVSDAYLRETQELELRVLGQLRSYDRASLDPGQQLSYDVYEWYLDDLVRGHPFRYHDYPLHHMVGSYHFNTEFHFTDTMPLETRSDAEDYVAALGGVLPQAEQLLDGLRRRQAKGIVPPRFIVELTIADMRRQLGTRSNDPAAVDIEGLPVFMVLADALDAMDDLGPEEGGALRDRARVQMETSFVPAWLMLIAHLEEVREVAGEEAGVWALPDGPAYYEHTLRRETSTDLTAAEIHEIGIREVGRLQGEMREVFARMGYPADESLGSLMGRAIREGGFWSTGTAAGRAEAVAAVEAIIADIETRAGDAFGLRPERDVVVVGDTSFGGGGAFYSPGSVDGVRPGAFHIGVGGPSVPRYRVPTVAYHEAVPGHHFQIGLAQEMDLPAFRRHIHFNGYTEGWALYAESLAGELGVYADDPIGDLGRLELELLRAVRLVTDTGIHSLGWSRQEARDYMTAAIGHDQSNHEVDRYVVLPGQATGYMIGLLEILELRERAAGELGDRFDIKAFHDAVVGNGAVPLVLLDDLVDDYVAATR